MRCTDGVERYCWTEIILTPEESNTLRMKPRDMKDFKAIDVLVWRIAKSKDSFNKLVSEIRLIFGQMRDQNYPLPHRVNIFTKSNYKRLYEYGKGKVPGVPELDIIFTEDYPLLASYTSITVSMRQETELINSLAKKIERMIDSERSKREERESKKVRAKF